MKREVTYKFKGKTYVTHINNKGMLIVLLGVFLTFLNIAIEIPGYKQLFMFILFFLTSIGFFIYNRTLGMIFILGGLFFYILLNILNKIF